MKTVQVPFQLVLTGDTADQHQFQGYDGYMALAGFAWTLALVSNYSETGTIRHRGDFLGRDAVRASPISQGSIIADFLVLLQQNPAEVLGLGAIAVSVPAFLHDLVNRVIARNLGEEKPPSTELLKRLIERRDGDIEALVARVEPAIRQTHSIIGKGAKNVKILGGFNVLNNFNQDTADYVKLNVEDNEIMEDEFSVAAFNVNSGYGSVYDSNLGRTVPISMTREVLRKVSHVFTWGLDQYANNTGEKIRMKYTRILTMDSTPKRYVVSSAGRTLQDNQ